MMRVLAGLVLVPVLSTVGAIVSADAQEHVPEPEQYRT
jgi:hypothetical protein